MELANNLSTIGYTILFSSRIFIILTIPLHTTINARNKKTDSNIVIHNKFCICSHDNPNSITEHTNQKTIIPTNTQLCKNLYFTYRIITFPEDEFSSTVYGCLFRINILLYNKYCSFKGVVGKWQSLHQP